MSKKSRETLILDPISTFEKVPNENNGQRKMFKTQREQMNLIKNAISQIEKDPYLDVETTRVLPVASATHRTRNR